MAITYDEAKGGYTDGATTWKPNNDGVYEIDSLDQLKFFRDAVNDGNSFNGQTVKLTVSINLNNEEWAPIGKSGKPFQGTFDGNGNTVSNLYINTPTQNDVGFFGYTSVGEIKNLTIKNANVTGYLDVGAVAGTPYTSKYTNITLTGDVKIQGFSYVGGMFGKNVYADLTKLTIDAAEDSYVTADSVETDPVEGDVAYRTYVGGVIGFMGEGNTVVKNVTSNINVSGSTCDVGGITGIAHYGNSFVNVTCTADEVVLTDAEAGLEHEVGGIAGVWYNQANTTVQFINCNVENTTAVKSILNGVEQDVSSNITSGKSYNAETATSGSQLIGQNVVIEADGKYSAGEFTVSGPNAVNVLNGKLSDGLTVYPTADGVLSVDEAGYVASVNNIRYKSLADAIAAAGAGGTVTLIDDVTLSSKLVLNQAQVFDLNGFTLDGAVSLSGEADVTFQNGKMTAAYSSTTSNSYSVVQVNGSSVLTLDGVTLTPADSSNRSQATHAIVYQSTGALNIKNSTVAGGNLVHDKNYTSGTNQAACAIYAYGNSAGTIQIEESTITGGAGKTDAEYDGTYKSGLYVEGGEAIKLGGSAAITINSSTVTGGASDWYNAADAVNVTNTFSGTLNIENASKISGGDALNLSGETSRGIGGAGIYTNQSTSCTEIVVTDSEIEGGNGGHSWNGSALELNTSAPEVTITNSTLTVGQGENSSGNAGAIRVNNTNTIDLNLNGVTLDGAGNANQVFQITSNVSNGGISLAGENTISGGTLENVTFIEVAEGTTITTTGDGKVDPVTVLNPVSTPVYDETTGAYVFEPVETSTATLLVNSNWASLPDGTAVQYDGANYRLGTNAFSDISDAAATEASNKILVIDGTYSGDQFFNGHEVEIGSADTAVSFENYVFGGAQNGNTGDISLKFVNGSAARVYGTALNQAGDYTTGNITLEISEDVALTERIGAAKIEQGNLTTGDVVINFAGSALPIFGGAQVWYKGSSATHDSVTINTSGTLSDVVYAAGQAMHGGQITINNGVTTNVTGGSIGTDGLMGGGFTRSDANQTDTAGSITIHGGTWINISGGEITNVYGGTHTYSEGGQLKSVSTITGGTHISMTGGTVGNVQGGGYTAWGSEATIDSTYVSISGGTVTGDVQGGSYVVGGGKNKDSGNSSTITGDATVVISGNANIQGSVYGGSWVNWATGTAASYIGGTSTVIVEGGTIAGNVAGGGVTYAYSGDGENSKLVSEHEATEVRLTGGTIQGSVIGGGVALDNYGKATLSNTVSETSVVIDGATVEGDIIAGGYAEGQNAETEVMGDVSLSIVSGTIKGDVYGGSIGGSIGGNSTISISGGDIQGGVYAADVTTEGFLGSSILNFDNEGALDTAITEINGFDEVNFNGGTVNFTSGTVSFANTVINMTVNGESSTLTAETIDNSATIYVTGTGAYAPNVNLIDEGKIVFGKKDATFDGTYAGTIDGQASDLATVQVLNGSLTLESGATIDLIGNFDKNRGFILGTVDAAEDDGTMTAVVTVKEGATLNARNYFWIGSANGSYETPEEQSKRFKLIIDGGKVDATSNAFTLRNTGAMEILNGGSFSAHDGSVRNYISVTGEGSYLEYGGNVYGEAPSGAEGAPTYGTASITVSDGATANFTKLSIGGEGASRENRRGSVTLSNATATAKTILLSQANENEEIRAELSLENSSLTADAITNYGAVNVTGASTLDAEFMAAGTGLLNLNSVAFGSGTSVNDTASYTNNTIGSEIVMTGTNTLTDGAFVSTGWSKNFRLGYETGTESDSLEISGGATLKVGGVSYIGSDPEDKKAGAYQVTVSGAGSSFAGSGAGEELYLRGDGRLTVKDDASASFSYADIKGSVILENGNFSFIDSRLIGTIAMDYASTLTFSGEINPAGGAITVDMTGFSGGVYKLIDYTGSNSYTKEQYKALIGEANWNENFTIVNNDLYAVNVDTSTLKVNTAWKNTEIGTEVEEGFYYGFNAFDTLSTTIANITNNTTNISIAASDYAGSADAEFTQGVAIDSNGAKFDNMWSFGVNSDTAAEFNPETAEKFTVSGELTVGQFYAEKNANVYVVIDGDLTTVGSFGAKLATQLDINGSVTVTPPENGAAQVMVYGTMNVTGTLDSTSGPMAAVMLIGNDRYDTEYGKGGVLNVTGDNASVTLRGNTDSDMPVLISGLSSLNLSDGATFTHENGSIENKGTINVASSTLTVGVALENSGTVNVSGTSTVAAEIDGALDLLNGADVTFAGGADDLLVASGAKVTLRGELSGNEVVYEKGYKYNDDDARGITVNIASGEGTIFQSYAWYASNGSTYNVQSGSSAEITYANINATGTINVAKDATLTVVKESSNIVGTLNVDGTANGVMTVYAGYTGGLFTNGAQAGEVNINGTGTVNTSIMTIGTAVRDDDKYNAAAVEGSNTTASVVVDGGTLNATGFEGELTSKLFVGSDDSEGVLTGKNGAKINVGERSANGTGYMRFIIGEQGTLNLDNSTMTVYNLGGTNNSDEGVFQNSGTINMDLDSQIVTATALENSGTITVDMTGAAEFGVYKLIDYTGTGTVDYGTVALTNNDTYGYTTTILNNDLYLVRADGATEYYVNSEWNSRNPYDEVTFVDETKAYYGLNAFDTVDHALTATSYENGIWLNVTGEVGAITVVGTDVTEVNASAKDQIDPETGTVAADAIVVNLVDINNTNAGWQVYYPLASGSDAKVYGDITTNFLSSTFTEGSQTADPNFAGAGYAGTTATVYGDTMVNIGADGAENDALFLNTGFLLGAGGGIVNGDSSLNIYSGTIEAGAVVGGGAWRGQVKGDSSVTISGGKITLVGTSTYSAVYGGSYGNVSYDPDAPGDPAATAGNTSVTIKGDAVVNGKVIGGSDQTAVTGTTVEISGEAQVNGNVYAGGNRGGQVTGNTSVTLTGGTVTGNVYGGGDNSSVIGDTSVIVNGADVGTGIFGGSLNDDVNNAVVEIRNFTRLQPVLGTQSDKIQIVGGGMAEAGKNSTTASTNVTVTDSRIYGDVVAGSSATGTGATAISGKSVVNVSNLEINGYSEGSNIWTGRVFGAGRAQYGGSVVTESTDVTIENMSGYTYDSEGNIIDGSNKGARVYGAGQAYASMSRVEVGETKLRISGDATNISEIYGGGIVSGTEVQEKAAFQIVGKTDVEITGGTVTDVIAGGNNTNWFGRTVIGVDAGDGTYQAAEGEYGIRLVIGGSTKVNEGALVTGGSYVDFAYEYQNIVDGVDTYGRTAEIYGNTYMELTGDSVISTDVFGGSFAYYEQVDFSADVSKLSAPSATQYGDVTVVVSGNTAIAGSVYGGGAVLTNTDQVKTTSVTNGDVSVLISGGAVGGNVYAGGYYADVNGNASVTLSGGTVGGDIYGGSEGSGTVAGSSTLNVGATDAARYTTTLNNVYDFDVANITNAAVTVEGVFSATQISIADSTLTLNSGFDAATTTVSIEVGAYNAENAALVLGSAVGTAPAISISAGSNALTEARYLVATGFDDTTAFSLDESLAGEYILRAVDGNIYLYNADAPYFTTELSVTQAEGASVDGYYSFTANFEAAGLLTGYTLKLYDSATATTPVDEVTLDADVIGQEFTLENTTQSFWISVTANGENGLSTDSPTSGRLEVVVKDYDSPVIQSVSSNVASDAITLTCEATDNFGVTGYEFILDGQSLGVQTGSEIALDLSTLTAGTHSYTVNVYDAAGNLATSAEQSFDFTPEPGPGPEPGPTEPANFLYSSQVRMDNGETVSVYATYSDAAAALEYRIGDSGEWLTYDATTGVNVSSSTTVYFREQGITDPVETAVDVTVVPADVELNAEVILLAPTTDTTYEVIYNFADGGSKAVELSGNSVEHYALPENTTVTIVEKDASGEVVNTIVEETPAASTTAEIPDKVVAVDDGHDNLFFAMPVGQWGTGIAAQHLGDGTWGGTLEIVSLTGKNRFSTVFTGSDDATTLFLTDDANGDVFFLDDIYTANGSDARIRKMSEIQAGAGDDIVDLTSARFAYEEHASKQLTVRGGDGNDILWGNAGHNIMFGDDGNDRIYGGSDNDVLIGGTGNDTMLGGGGDDIFCYGSSFDWGSDTITQLSGGTVTLYLDGIDRNDCSISGSTLTWNDGTHTGSITLNGVSWDSVKFYCAANGDGDLTKQSDYEELKNKGAFAAISSH